MNAPGRTMRPLPHSAIGDTPGQVTRDHLTNQIARVQTVGRSAVGNEAARKLMVMVEQYAATRAPATVPTMRPAAAPDQGPEWEQLRDLAAQRGEALRAANARVTELSDTLTTALAQVAAMTPELAELRASRDSGELAAELEAEQAEVRRLALELDTARNDVDMLHWLYAEAMHWFDAARAEMSRQSKELDAAHTAADYLTGQLGRRNTDLDEVRAESLRLVEELQAQREDLRQQATRMRLAWLSARARAKVRGARLRMAEDAAAGHADLETEIARLQAELDNAVPAPLGPMLVLTEEQVEQLRAEWDAAMSQPHRLATVSSADAVDAKQCHDCGETKPLTEFARKANAADGHRSYCRACDNRQRRERRAAASGSED